MSDCVGGQIPLLQLSLHNLMSRLEASWQIFSIPALYFFSLFSNIFLEEKKVEEFLFFFIGILINSKEEGNGMLGQQ